MLQLVLGGSGSGKTTLLYQKMKERAMAGQKSILIVPEQFTATTEAHIYHALGDAYSGMVQSYSFTTLAEHILSVCGGAAVKTLSDAGQVVLVRHAMQAAQDALCYYRKQRQSIAFCQQVILTINELKSAGLDPTSLASLAVHCGGGREKLTDLALIFAAYEAEVQATGLDPTDRVNLAAQKLTEACADGTLPAFLEGRAVFIDEFDTFNAPKKKLLGALFCGVESISVALCADGGAPQGAAAQAPEDAAKPSFLEDVSLFSGARRVAFDLRTLARKAGVGVAAPILLKTDLRHEKAPALAALSALLAGDVLPEAAPALVPTAAFSVFAAKSREEEAKIAATQMQCLARGGAKYGEMAIVCRDTAQYRTAVRRECRLAGIPLFCDETTIPTFGAPITAVRALLSILCGYDYTDQMIALAKTGLCATPQTNAAGKREMVAIPEYQILALENYVYTWSPHRSGWQQPFTRSEGGFGMPAPAPDAPEPPAETARKAILAPVERLCATARQKDLTAAALTKAVYHCLQALGAPEQQAVQVAALRKVHGIPAGEAAAREWNVVMELLDQMVHLLGEQPIAITEYNDLFTLLLGSTDLGHIPQNVDAAIFTAAGKMRLNAPKYVFLLGVAEGEFPSVPSAQGLLNHADRDALMAQEIELPDCFENKMVREDICFYKALTAPSAQLWVSYPEGLALPLSSALTPVLEQVPPRLITAADFTNAPSSPAAAIDALGSRWGENDTEAASLYAALQQYVAFTEGAPGQATAVPEVSASDTAQATAQAADERNAAQCAQLRAALASFASLAANAPKQLQDVAKVADLLGDTIEVSASKVEKYHICQYAYFMQYMLRLRPREKAELSPSNSGSLMHWVLEQAITPDPTPYDTLKPAPFVDLTAQQLKALAEGLTDAYQALYMPDDSIRFGYLMGRLKKSMVALLCYLQEELRQSAFAPAACEAQIGTENFTAPEYAIEGGKTLRLIGIIDRIDTWQDEAGAVWMRVVDYKTGEKTFSLKEVYDGLDCQMLLYLFAALHHWHAPATGDKKAAGVQYLLADPAPKSLARDEAQRPLRPAVEGMLADDAAVLQAADKDQTGEYLPFPLKNGQVETRNKKAKLADEAKMARIEAHLTGLLQQMAQRLYAGEIAAEPLCASSSKHPCKWCEFRAICGHEDGKHERGLTAPADPFEEPKEEAAAEDAGSTAPTTQDAPPAQPQANQTAQEGV